jgi:hypothetical protein
MKLFYLFIAAIVFFVSCDSETLEEKCKRVCPYELVYGCWVHDLEYPIEIIPNQLYYQVGDTITFRSWIQDSVYCMNTERRFRIENFPFKPILDLHRIDEDWNHEQGFDKNPVFIDEIYQPQYSGSLANGRSYYSNGSYLFEAKLVMKEKGKYIFMSEDLFELNNSGKNPPEWNAEANAITFEGQCEDFEYAIKSVIKGDDHWGALIPELHFLVNDIYRGRTSSTKRPEFREAIGGRGKPLEYTATYCFIVE